MKHEPWRGIFPIVITPFTQSGALDEEGLRRVVRFCLEAGAAGLVGPANASEFATLADEERRRWLEVVVGEASGQVPVVAAITSGHALPAAALGRFAQELGAAGVMSMPPHVLHPDAGGCYAYYQALDAALEIPVCVQNYNGPVGTPMSGELLARLCRELPQVQYIKEETLPEPRQLSATLKAVGDQCLGIFGGQGGIYILDEFRRGAAGNMPGCHTTDALADLWQLLEQGAWAEARAFFNRLLPLFNFERLYGVAVYKEILRRRGVIASACQRAPGGGLDEWDRRELDEIMKEVETLFRV
jgi:4-hydroxy-tetrahydrodipicolinate synthase